MDKYFQKCPVCDGHGYVDYPYGAAAGQQWSSTDASNHECHRCHGTGTIERPTKQAVADLLPPFHTGGSDG